MLYMPFVRRPGIHELDVFCKVPQPSKSKSSANERLQVVAVFHGNELSASFLTGGFQGF